MAHADSQSTTSVGFEDEHTLSMDVDSENATKIARTILSQVNMNGDITGISFEIRSADPFEFDLESVASTSATTESGVGTVEEETETVVDATSDESDTDTDDNSDFSLDHHGNVGDVVEFQKDGATWAILETLYERRDAGFLKLSEVQQFLPNGTGAGNSLSAFLGSLENRGFVEKRNHPRDGRRRIYQITGKGAEAVEVNRELDTE